MATQFVFGDKVITEPGVYSQIKSGINNPPLNLSYGNVLIIDTGAGAGYGAGPGINGTLKSGANAIQVWNNLAEARSALNGGIFWALTKWLFQPEGYSIPGISNLIFVKAATTVPAEMTFAPTGGGAAGGTLVIQVNDEGVIGNGSENTEDMLTKGYAFVMKAGRQANHYVLEFWRGTFKGLDTNDNLPWDFVAADDTTPELILVSGEFDNIEDIYNWCLNNGKFLKWFTIKTYSKTGTGAITAADLTTYSGNNLAVGGTETYGDLDDVLDVITDLDYTFILADNWGDNGKDADLSAILTHLKTESKYGEFMFIGGGKDDTKFGLGVSNGSIDIAQYWDDTSVVVVHGGFKKIKQNRTYKEYDSIFKAAAVLGRIAGLQPQVPGTFKGIDIDAEIHSLNKYDRVDALKYGVLHTKFDTEFNKFIINQAINSIQENTYLVNPNGTSHEIQVMRIANQLNKEIVYNAKKQLLGQGNGVNRNTLSKEDVKNWLAGYLNGRTATDTKDDLILSFRNIVVTVNQDAYEVTYQFIPNFPVNKLFFTGFMIDPNE